MALTRLVIRNVRNIPAADLALAKGFNFLLGPNGSGKTSVLEAIYMLGHGRTFRTSQLIRAIRHEQAELVVHGRLVHGRLVDAQGHERSIGFSKGRQGDSRIRIDGDEGYRVADLAQLLPIQLITPEGFTLLNGGPKYRRAFLDWGCFHDDPLFFTAWNQMRRLLRQRNAALRQASNYWAIRPWDQALVPLAQQVSASRAAYVDAITADISRICQQFLPEYSLTFTYQQGWEQESDYAQLLEQHFARDKALTYTSVGPHKADFRLRIAGIAVEEILSRGQLKLLMCALRLAQGEYLTKRSGRSCLYLLDDFASELDSERRALLAQQLQSTKAQVIMSAVNAEQIDELLDKNYNVFLVEQGKIDLQ